ncbi:MAG TPA: selenocysteine-specific translation elongation factor [Elusimicrobia bacterium]|jgi:selenocysteine-specific elongation factor|nr:selenocysteine-specific translation elongation factor [Elusimicrobiota bacterium]
MKYIVVGTAGHVDHGKTTLIKALTGIDTDRLKEEKERGMSIDIGFAYLNLPNDICAEIIDVPGHEHFIKNMLAGVGFLDLALLIIAANEGVMPQTKEHLDILKLLAVKKGIIVLTKIDLVDKEWPGLVTENIREITRNTFFENAPIVYVSGITGEGLEKLKQIISQIVEEIETKNISLPFRLPVDRVFKMEGFGTVITGTIVSGTLKLDNPVEVLPQRIKSRVRQLQSHKGKISQAVAGQRLGINLAGIKLEEINRGDTLAQPGYLSPTNLLDVHLQMLDDTPHHLVNRTRVRVYLGTGEYFARTRLLGRNELKPGEEGYLQLQLEKPVAVLKNDHFILRLYSPLVTIGGGKILDIHPAKHKRFQEEVIVRKLATYEKGSSEELVEQILLSEQNKIFSLEEIAKMSNLANEEIKNILSDLNQENKIVRLEKPERVLHQQQLQNLKEKIINILQEIHQKQPLRLNLSKEEIKTKISGGEIFDFILNELVKEKKIILEKDKVRLAEHQLKFSPEEEKIKKEIENICLKGEFTPLTLEETKIHLSQSKNIPQPCTVLVQGKPEIIETIVSSLIEMGVLIKLEEGFIIHQNALEKAKIILKNYLSEKKEITVSEYRQILNSSRKYTLPILQYFDTIKFTKRIGDKRVLA